MWEGSKWPSDSHLLLGSCVYKIGCVSTAHDAEYSITDQASEVDMHVFVYARKRK